jgi:two-component system cell cycle response regulator
MRTNKKVLLIVLLLLGGLSLAIVSNVWVQFVAFGDKATIDKANSIAGSVRDGLTAHMALGAMDKKETYLKNMIVDQDVKTLRVISSRKNMPDNEESKVKYASYDNIEKEVLKTAKSISKKGDEYIRITIPYIAYENATPNCLSCHSNVVSGDVLGAITLELNTQETKLATYQTIGMIIMISFLFVIIAFMVATYFIKPYIKLFDDLEEGISKAYTGDFSHSVRTKLSNEAGRVARRLNDLTEIFRFKKTIELDSETEVIYERIAYVLEHNFHLKEFIIFENSILDKTRKNVFKSEGLDFIELDEMERSKEVCRSLRTNDMICSTDFHKVCSLCYVEKKESICLPFSISEEISLTLLIYAKDKKTIEDIKSKVPIISNYMELAQPVLQNKLLMNKLHETTLIEPMTNLYNRRFLDTYMDTSIRENDKFSMLMVDIDFFKQINDTYGHDVGDEVIKSMAKVLKNNIKGADLAVRYGGEEFLVILFNTQNETAIKIANDIRIEFSKKIFKAEGVSFSKTLSIGIANFPEDSSSAWQCVKYADVALYNAKETGRDKVVSFESKMYSEELI